jgi:high affinity sulfate transporter 1
MGRGLRVDIPGLRLARRYERTWARRDLVAGIVLTALLVPQGMAYAELAGLPPVTGLYTSVVVLLAYAAFGPSRIVMLGPDSSISPLIAAAVLPLVAPAGDPAAAVALASARAVLIGLLCMAAGRARLGAIADLFSKPVRLGFLNGIALVVIVSQLPGLFGFTVDDSRSLGSELSGFVDGLRDGQVVAASLVLGVASLAVIELCARVAPRVPGVLIAVVGSALVVGVFDLAAHGVTVVGAIPTGFPAPRVPDVTLGQARDLFVAALGIAFVMIADTSILSRAVAARTNDHVDPNSEIGALGAANLGAGLFGGFPASASATRTLVAETAGARTQAAGVVAAVAIVAVLVFGQDLGRNLPATALAAVVIAGAIRLFDLRTAVWLLHVRRSEFALALAAFGGVALIGVLEGVAVAIALSIASFVWRAWRPYDAILGRVPDRKGYHDIERHPEAVEIPGLVLYRFDAPLFFANAERFANRLKDAVDHRPDRTRWAIVAAEPLTDIDTTAAEVLDDLIDELDARGVSLAFAELKGPVKDRLRDYDYERIGADRFFPTLGTAISTYLDETGTEWTDWTER